MAKKIIYLIALISIFSFSIEAKSPSRREKIADKLFEKLDYYKAAEIYSELADKKNASPEVMRKAAQSYRVLDYTEKSEMYYSMLIETQTATAEDYFYYAQMLKANKNYPEAYKMLMKFHEMKPDNSIGKEYSKKPNFVNDLMKDSSLKEVSNVANLNSKESDYSPYIYDDNTLVYTTGKKQKVRDRKSPWTREYFFDVFTASMSDKKTASNIEMFRKASKEFHEGPVYYNKYNNQIFVTRSITRETPNAIGEDQYIMKLFYSEKQGETWSELTPFEYNSDDYSVGHASLSPDGNTLYFSSDMPGSIGLTDIWMCKKEGSKWGKPTNLGSQVNTEAKELFPYIAENGILFFASEGHVGLGMLDVFMSFPFGSKFSKPVNMGYPLNTNADDYGLVITSSSDGYFTSNRVGGEGLDDIYYTKVTLNILGATGKVLANNTPVPNKKMTVKNADGSIYSEIESDENGEYFTTIQRDKSYLIDVDGQEYFVKGYELSSVGIPTTESMVKKDIVLNRALTPSVNFTVIDEMSNKPVANAEVSIKDMATGTVKKLKTNAAGVITYDAPEFNVSSKANLEYEISKSGYAAKSNSKSIEVPSNGVISIRETIKMAEGGDLALHIEPIYFDLNKYRIRPDAATELDKIVKILNDNPAMEIELGSHTDCRENAGYNQWLSDMRAQYSANYIKKKITNPKRVSFKGYGETKLVNDCGCGKTTAKCTEEQHQANRRTEFIIKKM